MYDKLSYLQEGIQPMWEDDRNRQGGRWLVNTQKNFRQQELDRLWVETVRSFFLFLDDKIEQCKCAVAATSHSCSFYAFSSALVAILVSLEQEVN